MMTNADAHVRECSGMALLHPGFHPLFSGPIFSSLFRSLLCANDITKSNEVWPSRFDRVQHDQFTSAPRLASMAEGPARLGASFLKCPGFNNRQRIQISRLAAFTLAARWPPLRQIVNECGGCHGIY